MENFDPKTFMEDALKELEQSDVLKSADDIKYVKISGEFLDPFAALRKRILARQSEPPIIAQMNEGAGHTIYLNLYTGGDEPFEYRIYGLDTAVHVQKISGLINSGNFDEAETLIDGENY